MQKAFRLSHHLHGLLNSVGLRWRLTVERRMGALGVVKVDPCADDPLGLKAVCQLMRADHLVFERPSKALYEDVIHAAALDFQGKWLLNFLQ